MKKTLVLVLMLVAILFVGVIPALAAEHEDGLARLTVVNNTDGKVFLQLNPRVFPDCRCRQHS